jgi:hypothetical protein
LVAQLLEPPSKTQREPIKDFFVAKGFRPDWFCVDFEVKFKETVKSYVSMLARRWEKNQLQKDKYQEGGFVNPFQDLTGCIEEHFRDCWKAAVRMAKNYLEVLELLLPQTSLFESDFSAMSAKYFIYGIIGRMEAMLKYHTTFLKMKCIGGYLPDRPHYLPWSEKDGYFLTPRLMRVVWLRCVLRKRESDLILANSLYQAKRDAEEVGQLFIDEALEKNFKLLTDEQEELTSDDDLIRQIDRTVKECYAQAKESGKILKPQPCRIPTLSACYERTRRAGGMFEEILHTAQWWEDRGYFSIPMLLGCVSYGERYELVYSLIDPSEIEERFQIDRTSDGEIDVRRVAVLEPFKVRVVSMGSAKDYQFARAYQRVFWTMLQGSKAFELTGKPIDSEVIDHLTRTIREHLPRLHYQMVSADYDAATDRLKTKFSNAALHSLCCCFRICPIDEYSLRSSLTGHMVRHHHSGVRKRQQGGQLMGSPLSFPILNLVNAAITRYAQEKAIGCVIPLGIGHKFNGDDAGFALPTGESYDIWSKLVSRVGLIPSVGKNFISRQTIELNSTCFKLPEDWDRLDTGSSYEIPFIKLNLLHNRGSYKRDTSKEGLARMHGSMDKDLRGKAEALIKGFRDLEFQDLLVRRFVYYSRDELSRYPPMSWWLPERLGGIGLPCPVPKPDMVSQKHLKMAAYLTCLTSEKSKILTKKTWCSHPGPFHSQGTLGYIQSVRDRLCVPIFEVFNGMIIRQHSCCKTCPVRRIQDYSDEFKNTTEQLLTGHICNDLCDQLIIDEKPDCLAFAKMSGNFLLYGGETEESLEGVDGKKLWNWYWKFEKQATKCSLTPMNQLTALTFGERKWCYDGLQWNDLPHVKTTCNLDYFTFGPGYDYWKWEDV